MQLVKRNLHEAFKDGKCTPHLEFIKGGMKHAM